VEGEGVEEREITDSAAVVRFYDAVRSNTWSAVALAHGETSIGQECLLTLNEIADLVRQAGNKLCRKCRRPGQRQ
jgi:aspartate aminotransferase-like enzyme